MSARPDLTSDRIDRQMLVNLMLDYITDAVVEDHLINGQHTSDRRFLIWHRGYIGRLEEYLSANGGEQFVPLPYWAPDTIVPNEFRVVKPQDDGTMGERTPLERFGPAVQNIPSSYTTDLCSSFAEIDDLANDLESFHNTIHGYIGGTMGDIRIAPAAPLFFCWHGWIDKVYADFESCGGGQQ